MTRKHFIAIAAALADARPDSRFTPGTSDEQISTYWQQWAVDVLRITQTLETICGFDLNGNRRFKRDRFLAACGLDA